MSRRQRRARTERRRRAAKWARRGGTAGGLAVAATLISGAVADAATFTVTTTSDSGIGSLRNAITYANLYGLVFGGAPSAIVFQSGMSGSITLASPLPTITAPIAIAGPSALGLTVSGNNKYQPFYIGSGLKGPSVISGLTITNGQAAYGGAIRAASPLILSGDNIISNQASSSGGGVYASQGLTVQNSTISKNNASEGAGLHVLYGLVVQNSTIATNTASADGGGIFHSGTGMTITDSTISGNAANGSTGGGISAGGTGANALQDTIVSGNTAVATGPDVFTASGSAPTASFSLIGNTSGSGIATDGTDIVGQDPMLGPVQANGGPTPTMAPAFNSPVIDAGSSFGLSTDQRGAARPVDLPGYPNAPGGDGSDIGAVEAQPSEVAPVVSGISRNSGTQGSSIGVFGSRITNATQVLFGSTPASFSVSGGSLNATVPPGSGTVDVRVVTPGGISPTAPTARFTYVFTSSQQSTAPPAPHIVTKRFGNQKISLWVPSLLTCTANSGTLPTFLYQTKTSKGTKLRFVRASYYVAKGIKHVRFKSERQKNGKLKRVTIVTYSPNLTLTRLSASRVFSLGGLKSGGKVVKVVMSYNKTVVQNGRRRTVSTTTSISARFNVC